MNREQSGEDWRESLLRAAFLIVGTGLVVGITVYRVFVPTVPTALVTSFFLGGLANLVASRFEIGSFAARGAMLIATSLALLAILVAHTAWTPAFSLYAVFIVLLAGLLFGRSAGL